LLAAAARRYLAEAERLGVTRENAVEVVRFVAS
jgi:hypothetical protein